jgi:hypothetical protein
MAPFFDTIFVPYSEASKLAVANFPVSWNRMIINDCALAWHPVAPCASLYSNEVSYGEKSIYTVKLVTWLPFYSKGKLKFVLTFTGAVPSHPNGLINDTNYQITLDDETKGYLNTNANWITDTTSTRIELEVTKFIKDGQALNISFPVINAQSGDKVGLKIRLEGIDAKGKKKIFSIEERDFETPVKLQPKGFMQETSKEQS